MVDTRTSEPVRRHLTEQQADKVDRLVDAALEEVRAHGYDGLTVRNVARRAGVAPATAYTFFVSKDHLIAEAFWRRLASLPDVRTNGRRPPAARAAAALREIADLVAAEPELAAAGTTAILAGDPDVHRLRERMGAVILQRLAAALGDDRDPAALRALGLAFSGAMLQAGMGYFDYDELGDRMAEVAGVVLGEARAVTDLVYSPYAYETHEDPYPTYARLRKEAPVYRNDELDFWALSRHADVSAAFRDSRLYSSANGVSLEPSATGPQAARTMSFLAMDPPRHGQLRGLVSRGFTPRRVADLEPHVLELARQYLDPVLEQGTFDFVADFAGRLPMDVISEMIGVPPADRSEVRRQADLLVHRDEGVFDVPPAGMDAALELAGYFAGMLAERRRHPTDDLTSALLGAELDGDRLSDDDIVSFLFLMVVAGNETTAKLLANAWYWAWRNPDQRAKPFADPARVEGWIEETLRYDGSSQMVARTATEPIELHAEHIPAGGRVLLLVGSANRDERVFPDAGRYDLDRDTSELVSFGVARHYCMGAPLARLEARVVLTELVTRVRDYDIDPDRSRRVHSVNVRGFESLPTTVVLR